MDFQEIIKSQFVWGLALGLLVAIFHPQERDRGENVPQA